MNLEIISASDNEASIICDIHNRAFQHCIEQLGTVIGYETLKPENVHEWFSSEREKVLLALINDNPVGYAHYSFDYDERHDFTTLRVVETKESFGQSRLAILPEYQKRGVGKKIVETMINEASTKGANAVMVITYHNNITANSLLSELQFQHQKVMYHDSFSTNEPLTCDSVLARFDLQGEIPSPLLNESVTIRKITSEDLEDLRKIFACCRPDMYEGNPSNEDILSWYHSDWAVETFVACLGGKVVGCMEYNQEGIIGIPGVLPEFQRQGIGSTLFYHLLCAMQSNGYKLALADTGYLLADAIRLYQRFGFDLSLEQWVWVKFISEK